MKVNEALKLENQICFPIYATSRMITRLYQPLLVNIELTYPQYLVMLVMWEHKKLNVSQLGSKLFLNTNTLTPLLKKMEEKKLLERERSSENERMVFITLTQEGEKLREKAADVGQCLAKELNMEEEELRQLHLLTWKFLKSFKE